MPSITIQDIANIPTANVIIICVTFTIAIIIIAVSLSRAGVIQFGELTVKRYQEGQSVMHSMNEENADTDMLLQQRLRQMTNSLKSKIICLFADSETCMMTRRAMTASLRFPLYESISNNHFTRELMPDSFSGYRRRILESLEDEYRDIQMSHTDAKCAYDNLPYIEPSNARLEQFVDIWLRDVADRVRDCSMQKVETYNKYMRWFEANSDEFRVNITKSCIAKNTRYIDELTRLIAQLTRDIEQRKK